MAKNIIIGIDVGGSTTKVVGFDVSNSEKTLITPLFVRATDPVASTYGAFGKFIDENSLSLANIKKVMITGVGSSYIKNDLYGLECKILKEFDCIGLGGLYLSDFDEAIVASLGTGTALVHAVKGEKTAYLGGTGVGGGTLIGLSKKMLGMETVEHIETIAEQGDLRNVDLKVNDLTSQGIRPGFDDMITASNFGKISDLATQGDIALGIINMVFETVGMVSVFAAKQYGLKNIVLTGNLTTVKQAPGVFESLNRMFDMNFVIPKYSSFGPAIGAALAGCEE